MNNKILFIPQHIPSLKEMVLISNSLKNGACVFYITFLVPDDILLKLRENDSKVIFSNKFFKSLGNKKGKIKDLITLPVLGFFVDFLMMRFFARSLRSRINREVIYFNDLISKYNIKKVVMTTDRSTGPELSIAVLATKLNLELIVISFAISADIKSSEKLRKSRFYYYEKKISWNSTLLPNGRIISFFKKYEKKVIESLGIEIKNPWVLGAGFSDHMLVDSIREKERLVKMGGSNDKYLVVGQISHDKLFSSNINKVDIRNKIIKKYSLRKSSIILIAMPQYYEHGLCDKDTHFSIVHEMVEMLSCLNCDVILSLHPKMNRNDYEFITYNKDNVAIVDEDLNRILPVCNIFVSTYSSTVSWALLCSKKVLIIDHISLDYSDFLSEYNLPILSNNKELYEVLRKTLFLHSDDFISVEEGLVKRLSPFDGKCASRIVDVLKRECNE